MYIITLHQYFLTFFTHYAYHVWLPHCSVKPKCKVSRYYILALHGNTPKLNRVPKALPLSPKTANSVGPKGARAWNTLDDFTRYSGPIKTPHFVTDSKINFRRRRGNSKSGSMSEILTRSWACVAPTLSLSRDHSAPGSIRSHSIRTWKIMS